MKLRDLLAELQKYNPDNEVVIYDEDIPGTAILFPFEVTTETQNRNVIGVVIRACQGSHSKTNIEQYNHADQAPDE